MTMQVFKRSLKSVLATSELIVVPGVYDLISATIADQLDFQALYMTGNGTVAASLGLPDVGLASYTEMVARVDAIAQRVTTPLIADGDTGYGGLLNVDRTVRGYERAGASAIQIEDQQAPKKCGFAAVTEVIELPEMIDKIKVAIDARSDDEFLIVARTDARRRHGFSAALERAHAFEEAGADIIFVEALETSQEMQVLCREVSQPKLLNMVDGRKTQVLSRNQIVDLGFNMVIYPCTGFLAATEVLKKTYRHIKQSGSSAGIDLPSDSFDEFVQLMGFARAQEFDERWSSRELSSSS